MCDEILDHTDPLAVDIRNRTSSEFADVCHGRLLCKRKPPPTSSRRWLPARQVNAPRLRARRDRDGRSLPCGPTASWLGALRRGLIALVSGALNGHPRPKRSPPWEKGQCPSSWVPGDLYSRLPPFVKSSAETPYRADNPRSMKNAAQAAFFSCCRGAEI